MISAPSRKPANLGVLGEPDDLSRWLQRLGGSGPLAVDTETTGLNWKVDRVGGICLAANDSAIYAHGNALEGAAWWLSDQVQRGRPLVFHNAKFDLHFLRGTFGLDITYPVDDTMVMSFLLDNRGAPRKEGSTHGGHGLKNLSEAYIDPRAHTAEERVREAVIEAGGHRGKKTWKGDILMADPTVIGRYGALDAWYTLRLRDHLATRLRYVEQPEGFPSLVELYETERWLLLALRDMEARGIRVNSQFFEEWEQDLSSKIENIESKLEELSGKSINWNSVPQLRELLYEEMGLTPTRWTKTGNPSTDEVSLLNLEHPIGAELLRLRDAKKQHSTYAKGLLEATQDGRIHANFRQTGTRTGRLSCRSPNLQQVPRESGARRGFVPDEGLVFRFADYAQVEMRYAAHFSDDRTLVEGFRHDPNFDTHSATAMKMWGMSEIYPDENKSHKRRRKFAKIMNFAMLFGAGENRVTSQLVSMLSSDEAIHALRELGHGGTLGAPHRTLAKALRKTYFQEFSSVKDARYRSQRESERRGYTVNAFGRRRHLGENQFYKSFNTIIQGSAADQAKKGLADVYREMQLREGSIALLLQIHDEIVYLSDGDPEVDRRVVEIINETERFRVPIVSDVEGSSTTWQSKEKIHL